MKFKKNGILISFDEFLANFAKEADIIKDHLGLDYTIEIDGSRLALEYGEFNPIYIDVDSKLQYHKNHFYKHSIYNEPLGRAIGLKKGLAKPNLLDATAGFLGDSLLVMAMGVSDISLAERNPLVAMLIANALKLSGLNLHLHNADCALIEGQFDVIYYDPMYAHTSNKRAAAKKEMMIFRDVVGDDTDSSEVANSLFVKALNRLVVKRALRAEFLIGEPNFSIFGKSTRYDVYLKI